MPSSSKPRPAEPTRRWKRLVVSGYRLGLLAAAFFCVHHASSRRASQKAATLDANDALPLVRSYLPAAREIGGADPEDRLSPVLDSGGETIGWAAQTAPEANRVTGYSGPSNLLVVFDASRRVLGTSLLTSADTVGHVAKITERPEFFQQWNGRSQASLGQSAATVIVSGASLTSEAMARGLAARFGAQGMDRWFPEETRVEGLREWFPAAASLSGNRVLAADGKLLGIVLRSSREGVSVRGFQGASDVLVALDPSKKTVLGVALVGSRDNEPYTSDVRDGLRFDQAFTGMAVADALKLEPGSTLMVSGASRTAEAVEETVREMLARHLTPPRQADRALGIRGWSAIAWVAAGLVVGLGPWRGGKRLRMLFSLVSVIVGGLWLGLMTGQDQWIKSAERGSVAGTALPLLALTAAAMLIPALTGKNVYCARLCPHGAAQEWIGRLRSKRLALPRRLHQIMATVPWLTLGGLWLLAFTGIAFPYANAEPFEIWSAGFFALAPVLVFCIGLVAAAFLPQAYCHYGCPTGAVLKFLSSSPSRLTKKDGIAGAVVAAAWLVQVIP